MIYVDDIRGETIYHHGIKGQRWGVKKRVASSGHSNKAGTHKMDPKTANKQTKRAKDAVSKQKNKLLASTIGGTVAYIGVSAISRKMHLRFGEELALMAVGGYVTGSVVNSYDK